MKKAEKHTLNRIRKGDIKSFEALFHRFYPGMCLYAQSLLKNETIAEEIVQDVFYNIWKNRKDFQLRSGWQSYLYRSVYNNSLSYLRKNQKEVLFPENRDEMQESGNNDPYQEMNYRELNETISAVLDQLPERTGRIFKMSRFEGLTYQEIATRLKISVKTVEANMGKALKAFRLSLEEYGFVKK
jgi:RNA polymerase sigma-70 factor (ECF subfamily)